MWDLNKVELFLLDMDGTLYLDNEPLPGAVAAVKRIKDSGRQLCFLTNNSSKSRMSYLDKLTRLGFNAELNEIYTSGMACIAYLKANHPTQSVYLLGTQALQNEFLESGIRITEKNPDIVVVGYDTELTYAKLSKACVYIRNGAKYLATHPDLNCPAAGGYVPDTGSFIQLIKASTDRTPEILCGKPYGVMALEINKKYNVKAENTAMVGDRLTTDLCFAKNNGFVSILVLSGETDLVMLENYQDKPDIVLKSIADLSI